MFGVLAWVVVPAVLVLFLVTMVSKQYKKCPSNQALVVYGAGTGKKGSNQAAKVVHGGGAFVIPLIQDYAYLSLEPIALDVDLKEALSKNNIGVNVPSSFTVGISATQENLNNAAQRLLGLSKADIIEQAKDIALGQLRLVIASMTIVEINQDREKFQSEINKNIAEELSKIGLQIINVNIKDITDESGYIEAIGRKAAETAKQQAQIDVAEEVKKGAIGEAEAHKEQTVAVAQANAEAVKGEKEAQTHQDIKVAELDAQKVEGENLAQASIADYNAKLAVKEATAKKEGEVAKANADRDVAKAEKEAEVARLEKSELAKEEVEKKIVEVKADALAEQKKREAGGEAEAVWLKYEAEAKGVKAVLESKAEGYKKLVESCGNDPKTAATLLLIEKMESIVEKQMNALKEMKIDKITVWDGGSGGNGQDGGFKNFMKDYVTATPAVAELAKQVGIEMPEFFGKMNPEPEKLDKPDGDDPEVVES